VPPRDALLRAPNMTLLPHIGSASHATRERMAAMAVDNCLAGLRGEPLPHPVAVRF
jgi:lactate dehydrogenase-like 2-hydroxyacid dehydrogenase